jgi:REP element-mobilizing transposase RayT
MARKPRIHFPGALFHVITRGNQRQAIFKGPEDFRRFQEFLDKAQKQWGMRLYAYALMPNHVHLLLQVRHSPLAKMMQTLLHRYTHYYNKRYRKVGHLFQGRYKGILCDRDEYLAELIRYIHLNPVRAQLVKTPQAYPWSSHRIYLGGTDGGGVAVEEILARWSKQRKQAVKGYERFVAEGISQGHMEKYYEVKKQRYLGEEEFVERVEEQLSEAETELPVRITMSEIVGEVARGWGMAVSEIHSKRRGRLEAMLRALAAYVGREIGGMTLTKAAGYLRRDLATLSIGVRKLEQKMKEDPKLRQRVEGLIERLKQGRKKQYQITKA